MYSQMPRFKHDEVAEQYHKAWKNVERGIRTVVNLI